MRLCIIAAVAENGVIGVDGDLPWDYEADLQHFKQKTMGHPLIMGRRTFESLPSPLPGRPHIVLSNQEEWTHPRGDIYHAQSIEESLETAANLDEEVAYVAGGGVVYEKLLSYAEELILTEISRTVDGDTYFPSWDREDWTVVSREEHEEFDIVTYRRKENKPSDRDSFGPNN